MKDIEYFTDEELKRWLRKVVKELQNRDIKFCLRCGETDFFNNDCVECKRILKKCEIN